MYLEYNSYNSTNILHAFAAMFGVRANDNYLIIPKNLGDGFMQAFNFNSGISVLVSDMCVKEELEIKRNQQAASQYFILLFNEHSDKSHESNEKSSYEKFDLRKKIVRLSTSLTSSVSILPANFNIRSVFIIFNKQSLLNFIDFITADNFINIYFPIYLKKSFIAPMDAEYRWILQDMHNEITNHPLQKLFTENKTMLFL